MGKWANEQITELALVRIESIDDAKENESEMEP
jgi:hypothetical protein